ncbi:baseplate J/gp47 family protein [Pseudoalteromonas sp. GB56]
MSPPLQSGQFSKSATVVYGNVVCFGHGESKSENVLGDGDRVVSQQSFVYQKKDVAFVQDTEFSSGVKAAVRIWADQREWTQVENLRNSEPTDTHYQVQLTQDGFIKVTFGNGMYGQRLPTGTNNVRIQARFGNGVKGNLAAFELVKMKQPHRLLSAVVQPAQCTGGGDLENQESIRSNAPASVLTLSRAVSVADFQALAKRQSSVWHAHAYALAPKPGSADSLAVVIVPAGGGALGEVQQTLTATLMNQAQPGVNVVVKPYQPVVLSLDISIRVDAQAYNLDDVTAAVRAVLNDTFSLQHAEFGKTFYRSQLYQIVEAVEGVENADCVINNTFVDESGALVSGVKTYLSSDGYIRNITPNKEQIIFVNANVSAPIIRTEVFNG